MRLRSRAESSGKANSRLRSPTRRRRPCNTYTLHASTPAKRRAIPRGSRPRGRATDRASQYSSFSRIKVKFRPPAPFPPPKKSGAARCRTAPLLFAALPLLAILGRDKIMRDRCHKLHGALGNRNLALENVFETLRPAKVKFGILGVLAHAGAVQIDSGQIGR